MASWLPEGGRDKEQVIEVSSESGCKNFMPCHAYDAAKMFE